MYSAVHIYTNLPVAVKVVDRRKVKSWDVLHGHSVPREFKLLYALQGKQIKHPVYLLPEREKGGSYCWFVLLCLV